MTTLGRYIVYQRKRAQASKAPVSATEGVFGTWQCGGGGRLLAERIAPKATPPELNKS